MELYNPHPPPHHHHQVYIDDNSKNVIRWMVISVLMVYRDKPQAPSAIFMGQLQAHWPHLAWRSSMEV